MCLLGGLLIRVDVELCDDWIFGFIVLLRCGWVYDSVYFLYVLDLSC